MAKRVIWTKTMKEQKALAEATAAANAKKKAEDDARFAYAKANKGAPKTIRVLKARNVGGRSYQAGDIITIPSSHEDWQSISDSIDNQIENIGLDQLRELSLTVENGETTLRTVDRDGTRMYMGSDGNMHVRAEPYPRPTVTRDTLQELAPYLRGQDGPMGPPGAPGLSQAEVDRRIEEASADLVKRLERNVKVEPTFPFAQLTLINAAASGYMESWEMFSLFVFVTLCAYVWWKS